jgi:predicted membrane channel-forming protein YqfA (hemolysin III family)
MVKAPSDVGAFFMQNLFIVALVVLLFWIVNYHLSLTPKARLVFNWIVASLLLLWLLTTIWHRLNPPQNNWPLSPPP